MANQGFHHPVYNPNGSKLASDGLYWYNTTVTFNSIADCFTESKLTTASGYIGTTSARPDGIFYDQVHEGSILDLRNSSQKVEDYNRLIDREFNKAVAGTTRGSEGEGFTKYVSTTTFNTGIRFDTLSVLLNQNSGANPVITDLQKSNSSLVIIRLISDLTKCLVLSSLKNTTSVTESSYSVVANTTGVAYNAGWTATLNGVPLEITYVYPTTRTKSNTLTHCDIIGNPANYPTSFKQSGVFGTPLIVAEDGTSLLPTGTTGSDGLATFKLSRKANATPLQVLKSTDSGATWTALTVTTHYTLNTTTNTITFTAGNIPLVAHLVMVVYQTHTSMATPTVNSEVLAIGNVNILNYFNGIYGGYLANSLYGKVVENSIQNTFVFKPLNTYSLYQNKLYAPTEHSVPSIGGTTTVVKVFPYLTRSNGKAWLVLVFKEMKYTTSWGDDSKFNIVDNVSTTTDNNAQTVLIGQKRIELPYFISASE